jgi:phosphatidylinositol dimannoside acyltransferase
MDFQQLINSPFAVRFIARLARAIPPRIGYPVGDRIGNWIANRRDSRLTQTVRCHQWMARGANLEPAALDRAVRETLQNNARDIYSLYHYLHNPDAMQHMIRFSPQACEVIRRAEFGARGLVILGIHLSNFDLVLRSIFQRGFKAIVLTIPDPRGGRRVEYEMRKQIGMDLVPGSVGALRAAVKHLENGGMLVTGLDRPVPPSGQRPLFFGKPASLPTHHVYLASKARVPIVIMAAIQQLDGKYHVFRSEFIEMEHDSDRDTETLRNAERVLKQAEVFIRQAPQQWNVPLPIWPELLSER